MSTASCSAPPASILADGVVTIKRSTVGMSTDPSAIPPSSGGFASPCAKFSGRGSTSPPHGCIASGGSISNCNGLPTTPRAPQRTPAPSIRVAARKPDRSATIAWIGPLESLPTRTQDLRPGPDSVTFEEVKSTFCGHFGSRVSQPTASRTWAAVG